MVYADVIVDISHENLDKTYQYAVPCRLEEKAVPGALVRIPFGSGGRRIKGYITGLSDAPKCPVNKIKEIDEVIIEGVRLESHLITLAYWIKEHYGGTMNDALKTVLPIRRPVRYKENKYVVLAKGKEETGNFYNECIKKHNTARARLLEALLTEDNLPYELVTGRLAVSSATIRSLSEAGWIRVCRERIYRNPVNLTTQPEEKHILNGEQRCAADSIISDYWNGIRKTYLIHGITGSGKTEVYMEVIEAVIAQGRQVIMLIPEIALTFQTVMRFYKRFGDRVSVLHSRLSAGEKYDQYTRAGSGEIDIMIGPRSALFTPFVNLGLIILDEEHEASYKSESIPKYHARETAIERAGLLHASVILGSATPSIESYKKALDGEYGLFELKDRAGQGELPNVWITDLREELKNRNRSILSVRLKELMKDRLEKKQQIILFINRRGYAGFVSCRSCGHVIKCPHCDVSLKSHNNGKLLCHYCGHEEPAPRSCPECGSRYIAAFGTGTQKVEEYVKREFPEARILRMDLDTTQGKEGHEKILSAFAEREADILVGTQMIVKGHDFPGVTLVGVIAADLSLYSNDYRAAEKTFQLLTQAAGRAGRGKDAGEVVIQTYNPDHYSIKAAALADYQSFYRQEIAFRNIMGYPPAEHMLVLLVSAKQEEKAGAAGILLYNMVRALTEEMDDKPSIIGPARASLSKINDIYRRVLYIKYRDYLTLIGIKNNLEQRMEESDTFRGISVQFDFNPLNSY